MKTSIGYFADFVLVPLYALAALVVGLRGSGDARLDLWGLAFAAGWFVWTFAEYAIHRWVFHVLFPRQHWLHHIRPTSMSSNVSVQSWHSFLGLSFAYLASIDLLGLNAGSPFFAGICAGYWFYSFVHFAVHHLEQPGAFFGDLAAIHDIHHRRPRVNFGVQTVLWDRLLGTFQAPRKK